MTQEELAEALNITPMHLRQIESERRRPSVEVLLHLAVILNLSLDALLFPEKAGGQEERAKLRRLADTLPERDLRILLAAAEAMREQA